MTIGPTRCRGVQAHDVDMPEAADQDSGWTGERCAGRADELRRVDELLEATGAGTGGVLVVSGPVGIGKSVVLAETARRAADLRVVSVTGTQASSHLPFVHLRQLLTVFRGLLGGAPRRPNGPPWLAVLDAEAGRA